MNPHGLPLWILSPARLPVPPLSHRIPLERESVYFRQIQRGNVIIGGSTRGPVAPELWRAYVQPQNTLSQLREVQRLAPALARLNVIRVWSGIEGYTPDDMPVMGPSEHSSGLYYAFGFSGSGFQLGPGVGDVMAELIDTGTTDVPLEDYRVGRFAGRAPPQPPGAAATLSECADRNRIDVD